MIITRPDLIIIGPVCQYKWDRRTVPLSQDERAYETLDSYSDVNIFLEKAE